MCHGCNGLNGTASVAGRALEVLTSPLLVLHEGLYESESLQISAGLSASADTGTPTALHLAPMPRSPAQPLSAPTHRRQAHPEQRATHLPYSQSPLCRPFPNTQPPMSPVPSRRSRFHHLSCVGCCAMRRFRGAVMPLAFMLASPVSTITA